MFLDDNVGDEENVEVPLLSVPVPTEFHPGVPPHEQAFSGHTPP